MSFDRFQIYFVILIVFVILTPVFSQISVTFRVESPSVPEGSQIYITGNQSELGNWNPALRPLEFEKNGTWSRVFEFPENTELEYKFTRGDWRTEAVDDTGIEYPNFKLVAKNDTVITIKINHWRDLYSDKVVLSADRFEKKAGYFEFYEKWKYQPGDNPRWASPDFDDQNWPEINSSLSQEDLKKITWEGIGWFRFQLQVDSSLWRKPFALFVRQAGALDLYLNGKHLYSYGEVAASLDKESAQIIRIPRYILFDNIQDQLLAVRFSNYASHYFSGLNPEIGFNIYLRDLNESIEGITGQARDMTVYQMIFTILPLTLASLHLLLFLFYRDMKENLYFGIFMICFAFLSFSDFQPFFVKPVMTYLMWMQMSFISVILTVLFGLLTSYQRAFSRIPKIFLIFTVSAMLIIVWSFISEGQTIRILFYIYLILSAIELVRVNIVNLTKNGKWEWVIGIAFFILVILVTYQFLINSAVIEPIGNQTIIYVYGILFVSVAASINLARDFSKAQETLLLQEREAKELEIKRRVLESDNLRKTQELEEARKLQLSMLPEEIPQLPHLDIAVYMKTATEVGGDYYDFKVEGEDALTVVIGDATGHGTKAGIMVALIKNIFNSMGHTFFIPDFFKHTTKLIKQMNLGHLYMALMLLKMKKNQVIFSAAGMPPIFIFRAKDQIIEEQVIKGLPLGGIETYSYEQQKFEVSPGDVMLMMTDGFAELFSPQKDTLDFPRVKEIFLKAIDKDAKGIINQLVNFGEKWRGNRPQNDDITFIVIKINAIPSKKALEVEESRAFSKIETVE